MKFIISQSLGEYICKAIAVIISASCCCVNHANYQVQAQSIGFHPQFNFGFNPYTSPVFGYGLGLPFGAYNMSPAKNPLLTMNYNSPSSLLPYVDAKSGFMSKLHAKAFLKKLASTQILSSGYLGMKDKLNLIKHPEYAFTPYGTGYGYGGHYGAAVVPNNPYKSTYGDYYDSPQSSLIRPTTTTLIGDKTKPNQIPIGGRLPESSAIVDHNPPVGGIVMKPHSLYLKPLIKAGALLTAVLLGKKALESPFRLDPSGMILSETRP